MYVVFIHGPPAVGKYTIGSRLSALTGLPLFHNHLAVDAAMSLFAFGTPQFNAVRAAIWGTVFREAALSGRSFIFTFSPESTVEPSLIEHLVGTVSSAGGKVLFVELLCTRPIILQRLGSASRSRFGKLTDPATFAAIEREGGFHFPPLPSPLLRIRRELHSRCRNTVVTSIKPNRLLIPGAR
jgi:hypothetical protein